MTIDGAYVENAVVRDNSLVVVRDSDCIGFAAARIGPACMTGTIARECDVAVDTGLCSELCDPINTSFIGVLIGA